MVHYIKILILLLFTSAFAVSAKTQNQVWHFTKSNGVGQSGVIHYPTTLSMSRYPTIIHLHGLNHRGPAGDTVNVKATLEQDRLPELTKTGQLPVFTRPGTSEQYQYIIVSPQCRDNITSWDLTDLKEIIAWTKALPNVDTTRISLWGLSMGGGGCITALIDSATASDIAAAIIVYPTSKMTTNAQAKTFLKSGVASWFFCAADDDVVTVAPSDNQVALLNANLAGTKGFAPRYYRYTSGGHTATTSDRPYSTNHNSYSQTNGDNAVHNPNAFEWVLEYRKIKLK